MNENDQDLQSTLPTMNESINSTPQISEYNSERRENLSEDEKERIINDEILALLSEISVIKEKGNALFKSSQFQQAEEIYTEGINKINTYIPSQTITKEVPQIMSLIQQLQVLLVMLMGNLSVALGKQNNYKQAIEKALNIIQLDPMNEKSYSRLLQWFIANGEIEKANYIAKEIKSKFSNNLANFKDNLEILNRKNQEFEAKFQELIVGKRQKSTKKGWSPLFFGSIALIASGLLVALVKYKGKGML